MVATTRHLMTCGFNVVYNCTHSDEISLLFHPAEDSFGRQLRKLISVLAREASAAFAQLPAAEQVVDYFRWRSEDAHRNALNAHCYWLLRAQGLSACAAYDAIYQIWRCSATAATVRPWYRRRRSGDWRLDLRRRF